MVIQRIQTVFLLIAAALMAWFVFAPLATFHLDGIQPLDVQVTPRDYPVFLVLNILIAVLLFIAIFLFKKPKQQKKVTLLSILLIAASAVTGGLLLYGPNAPKGFVELEWTGGALLLVLALGFALLARKNISKDIRTLSSYDRIR